MILQAKLNWEAQQAEREQAGGPASLPEPDEQQFVAYVPLPSDQEMEQQIIRLKKEKLLAKYTSDAIQRQQDDVRLLLNK